MTTLYVFVFGGFFWQEETKVWYKRPCPLPLLNVMALSVVHLQPLRMALLDSLLMDYTALVDTYLSNSQFPLDDLENINLVRVRCLLCITMKYFANVVQHK